MLVSELAGVYWLWPFMVLGQIYGISIFGHYLCQPALLKNLWPKFEMRLLGARGTPHMLYVVLISISIDLNFLSIMYVYVKCQCFVFKCMWFIHYMQHVEMQVSRVITRAAEVRCPRSLPNLLNSLNLGMFPSSRTPLRRKRSPRMRTKTRKFTRIQLFQQRNLMKLS